MATGQAIQDTHNQDIPCLPLLTHPCSQENSTSPIVLRLHILHQLTLDILQPSQGIHHLSQATPKITQATHPMLDQAIPHTPNLTQDTFQLQYQDTQQHFQQSILHASQVTLHPWIQATRHWVHLQTSQPKALQLSPVTLVPMHLMSLKGIAT